MPGLPSSSIGRYAVAGVCTIVTAVLLLLLLLLLKKRASTTRLVKPSFFMIMKPSGLQLIRTPK